MVKYYLYDRIPGTRPEWTLAVLAVSQTDADQYIKSFNRGGHRCGTVESGVVKADCGAVTASAQSVLERKNHA